MLRLLADENFNGDIVRGIQLRDSEADVLRLQDVGLLTADDPSILAWAAENDPVLLTHDRATMPDFAYARVTDNEPMGGVFILDDRFPIGLAIQEILLIAACSAQTDWTDQVVYLPL